LSGATLQRDHLIPGHRQEAPFEVFDEAHRCEVEADADDAEQAKGNELNDDAR
jgi:hypothetical protein